jgi:uncharacterized protein (TIGR02145 family)
MKTKISIHLLVLGLFLLTSCINDEPIKLTILSTGNISLITYNSAKASAEFADVSGNVSSFGHCWNTSGSPTINDSKYIVSATAQKGEYSSDLTALLGNTKYFVRAYAQDGGNVVYGNEIEFTTSENPSIIVTSPTIIDHWVCDEIRTITWTDNIIENVKICLYKNNIYIKDIEGSGGVLSDGSYSWHIASDLVDGVDYTIRIISTTDSKLFGETNPFEIVMPLTDIDGNVYKLVKIGTKWWMKENLKTTKYSDGTLLNLVTNYASWAGNGSAYCWYNNDPDTYKNTYGALYNWSVVNWGGVQKGICPSGWHAAYPEDWNELETFLISDGFNYDGTTSGNKIAKALSMNNGWAFSDIIGSVGSSDYPDKKNISGFSAKPGGYRNKDGTFYGIGQSTTFWNTRNDQCREIYFENSSLNTVSKDRDMGLSIRCVKD